MLQIKRTEDYVATDKDTRIQDKMNLYLKVKGYVTFLINIVKTFLGKFKTRENP